MDVSRAGLRKGLDGQVAQSTIASLVRHVFRLLETALKNNRGIPWVLLENVEGLLDRAAGQPPAICYVVEEFERLGYTSWAHRIINTASFGAPNRRKQVFLVASLHGDARDVLLSQGFVCKGACYRLFNRKPCYLCHQAHGPNGRGHEPNCSFALDLANAQIGPAIDMVPTFKTGNTLICLLLKSGQLGDLRTEDAERLQGFEEGHTCFPIRGPESCLDGAPSLEDSDEERRESHRWALLENAVSVPVAAWLGERLANPHTNKYYPGPKDRKLTMTAAAAPQGSRHIHHAAANEWVDIEDDSLVPKAELYEFHKSESPGEEERAIAGCIPAGAATSTCEEAADRTLSDEEPMSSTPAAVEKERRITEFRCNIMRKASNKPRQGITQRADRTAWPRAAWYIRGLGRHVAEGMSEAPVLRPMTLLGDFITKVGRAPDKEALTAYFARMGEQGFNMESVLRRAQQCGAALDQEAVQTTQLQGYTSDVEKLGTLVWARNTTGAWWPGEALDPHYLPPTRTIPPLAAAVLTNAEYLASIHKYEDQAPPPPMCIGSTVVEGTAAQHGIEETAAGNDAGDDTPRVPTLRDTISHSKRKVLVIIFGERICMWHSPAQLLPFKCHLFEKLTEGNELIEANKMPRPHLFTRGVQEAKEFLDLMAAAAKEGAEAETGIHREALAALAAARAAVANLRVCCGYCEACLATQGASRRCLVNRAAAAAAGGHSGAQLAVTGERAIGARISVWWPLDEDWYTGFVTAFDPIRQRHSICYDDGDVEIICLWASNQLVRVVTDPGDWPKQAERIATEQKLHSDAAFNQRRAGTAAAQDPQDPPAIMLDTPPLNKFEQQRMDNIARNSNMLANLGVPPAAEKAAGPITPAAQGEQAAGTMRSYLGNQEMPATASRKGITVARDSKGRFIGSSTIRRRARVTAGPVHSSGIPGSAVPTYSLGRPAPGTVKSLQSSGMTVPVVEGSLTPSVACDMATWVQHEEGNVKNVTSLVAGQWHAGGDEQAAEHAQKGPSEACAADSHGEHAALVLPEALANLGCEVPMQAAPPEAVREDLFGMAILTPCKAERKRKVDIATATGTSRIAHKM